MLKEGLQAYLLQRIAPDGMLLGAGHLLFLATLAGAEALGLSAKKPAILARENRPISCIFARPADSPLAAVLERGQNPESALAAIFTLAGAESVREVRVEGSIVFRSAAAEQR